MAFGAVGESITRSGGPQGSVMLSAGNMERLVAKLSKMRGAALKLGQMMSFQDAKLLPKPIHDVLQRVQDSADYMPVSQRDAVIAADLGPNWRDLFEEFEDTADILFLGTGTLSRLLWPDIDGLKDFDGRLVHSAHWDISDGAWEEGVKDWGDKSVGVIGLVCPCHPLCRVNLVPDFRRVHLPSKLSRRCSQRWRK